MLHSIFKLFRRKDGKDATAGLLDLNMCYSIKNGCLSADITLHDVTRDFMADLTDRVQTRGH